MARKKRKQKSTFADDLINSLPKETDPSELLSEGALLSQLAGRPLERSSPWVDR